MSDLVTYCCKHDVAVYPDAGKKYLAEFHERHKDCCQALDEMSEAAREVWLSRSANENGYYRIDSKILERLAALLEASDE